MMVRKPGALLFDVFGTVVDWRGGVARELRRIATGRSRGKLDAGAFADAWRAGYQPAMQRVRESGGWKDIDTLHREILDAIVPRFGLRLSGADAAELNLAWHRLPPWPDSVAGLTRLKRRFLIGTLSNGNLRLLVDMAKRARLPWDCVLSAELFRHYKPDPEVYLGAAALLGLEPRDVMLVAAHKSDLAGARACGLATAFVRRPLEFGRNVVNDVSDDAKATLNADDFVDLARQLGC